MAHRPRWLIDGKYHVQSYQIWCSSIQEGSSDCLCLKTHMVWFQRGECLHAVFASRKGVGMESDSGFRRSGRKEVGGLEKRSENLSGAFQECLDRITEGLEYLHLRMTLGEDSPEAQAFLDGHPGVESNAALSELALGTAVDWMGIYLLIQDGPEAAEFEEAVEEIERWLQSAERGEAVQRVETGLSTAQAHSKST